jgi:hypothetical protein
MQPIPYRRHQFPPEIMRHTVWLYLRFTLSYRDVEELLAKRGPEISYETIALGPQFGDVSQTFCFRVSAIATSASGKRAACSRAGILIAR